MLKQTTTIADIPDVPKQSVTISSSPLFSSDFSFTSFFSFSHFRLSNYWR
jgi:hypothetical protein